MIFDSTSNEADIFVVDDVLAHTLKNKNAHFAKFLLNEQNCQSLLIMKLEKQSKKGLIIFAKSSKNGFNQSNQQVFETLKAIISKSFLD